MVQIYSPEGEVGSSMTALAAFPEVLSGKRVLGLDNGKPGADVLLRRLAEGLAARSGAVVAGIIQKGSAATPCEEDLLEEISARADLVLTGTAD
jgi:hypothetical protein